ncbi:VOC family protein [bacterium]|nr:VOC family protein [bacterium]
MDLTRSEIGLAVKDLDAEIAFFEKLGFKACENQAENPAPHRIMTDGRLVLGLYQLEFEAPLAGYYCEDIVWEVQQLRKAGIEVMEFPDASGGLEAAVAQSPSGVPLFLQPGWVFKHPERVKPFSRAGVFGELAIPVADYDAEAEFWIKAGFEYRGGPYTEPERWGILGDPSLSVGIHQTDNYDKPALTFFSMEQKDLLYDLAVDGAEFQWTTLDKDRNIVNGALLTPNGYLVFLFTGDLSDFK